MCKPAPGPVLAIWKSASAFAAQQRFFAPHTRPAAVNMATFKPLERIRLRLPAPVLPLHLLSLLFALAMLSYTLKPYLPARASVLAWLLAIASCANCGLGWLLSRELFRRPGPRPLWPAIIVAGLFALAASLILLQTWLPSLHGSSLVAMLYKLLTLLSSTVLLLPLVEATEGLRAMSDKKERSFRLLFAAGYGLLLLCSLAASLPMLAPWQEEIKTGLAALAFLAASLAIHHRLHHPILQLQEQPHESKQRKKTQSVECDPAIARKIKAQLEQEQIYLDAEIKVADLAEKINEQEYKVTQCITGELQFRNFNHMLNTHRIAKAQKLLADPNCAETSILTIAMDSGFNSVGPFNRAFKALVGKTPSEYRSEVAAH